MKADALFPATRFETPSFPMPCKEAGRQTCPAAPKMMLAPFS